ncbi:hypothetical protein HHI36_020099, partial [Cryptolaemus montrouzieri]
MQPLSNCFLTLSSLDIFLDEQVIIIGDFNVPSYVENVQTDAKGISLKMFAESLPLKLYNNIVTDNNRSLDLIFSNKTCKMLDDASPLVPIDYHHPPLNFSLDVEAQCVHDLG